MNDGIFVSWNTLRRFPTLASDLWNALSVQSPPPGAAVPNGEGAIFTADAPQPDAPQPDAPRPVAASVRDDDPNFAKLTLGQARNLLPGLQEKVQRGLAVMVGGDSPTFKRRDVAKVVGVYADDPMPAVFAALTRRARNPAVTGNPRVYLIHWREGGQVGDMTVETYRALRQALHLD